MVSRGWRLIVEGKAYDFVDCTTCNMRRHAHKLLGGRGGEVEVLMKVPNGEYRRFLTFTVPRREDVGSRPRSIGPRRSEVRGMPAGVRPERRDPQRGSHQLGRAGDGDLSNVSGQSRQPWLTYKGPRRREV